MTDEPTQPNPSDSESPEQAPGETPAPQGDQDDTNKMAEEALASAREAISSLDGDGDAPVDSPPAPEDASDSDPMPFVAPDLPTGELTGESQVIDLLDDVNLNVTIELGRTRMLIEDVLRLSDGAVVELDKLAGDPVDVYVNDRHIARGEVLVLNENFCVRINEIIEHDGARPAAG